MSPKYPIPSLLAFFIHGGAVLVLMASFGNLFKAKERSYGMYMIAILHIAYICYPLLNLVTIYWVSEEGWNTPPSGIIGGLAVVMYVFTINWTAANAMFTYLLARSVIQAKNFSYRQFITKALIICIVGTAILPIGIFFNPWGDEIIFGVNEVYTVIGYMTKPKYPIVYFIVRDVIGRLIAEIITAICYFKLYKIAGEYQYLGFSKGTLSRLRLYSLIPIIWYIPAVIYTDVVKGDQSPELNLAMTVIIMVLRYFWEFLNIWVYWNFNANSEQDEEETENSYSTASTQLSSML